MEKKLISDLKKLNKTEKLVLRQSLLITLGIIKKQEERIIEIIKILK